MRPLTRAATVAVLALVLLAAACGDDSSPTVAGDDPTSTTTTTTTTTTPVDSGDPTARLAAARELWADAGPESYLVTTQQLCFCPETVWTDVIENGEVTSHEPVGEETVYDPGPYTMEDLFDEVEAVIAEGYVTLELELDPETGALVRYWVDVDEMIADEEHGVDVRELAELADSVPMQPSDIEISSLTDDYGCGYGFAKGSPGQDLALIVTWIGDRNGGPLGPATVSLPDPEWKAEIHAGRDLFANWCDDVVEPGEPEPVVVHVWAVDSATLELDGPVSDQLGCGSAEVRGTLTDIVVSTDEQVELGGVTLLNPSWGCFAG